MTKEQAEKIVETAEKTTQLARYYRDFATALEKDTGIINVETVAMSNKVDKFHLLYKDDVCSLAKNYGTDVVQEDSQIYTIINGIRFFATTY